MFQSTYCIRGRRLRPRVACSDCHALSDPSLVTNCDPHKHHVVRKIVRKYQAYARNVEFRRLSAIVPALAHRQTASKVSNDQISAVSNECAQPTSPLFSLPQADILEETIRYIDCLHERLLATVERLPQTGATHSKLPMQQ
jgi:hypothetical protein